MYQTKDSGFTLFGRRIEPNSGLLNPPTPVKSEAFLFKVTEVAVDGPCKDDSRNVGRFSTFGESDKENINIVRANEEQTNSQTESSGSEQEKTLQKPDKIVPCPRCNSMETKFCYFNNYNVNQPRHFCKNCQRYWTAGGMMRNVPVGAGRRKNKHLASQYRQILISSDGTPSCSIEGPDAASHQLLSSSQPENASGASAGNGTVLTFGRDEQSCVQAGSVSLARNREEPSSCVSSMTTSSSGPRTELRRSGSRNEPFMQCYPAAPWVFPCNPAQYPSQQVHSFPTPMLAVPGFYPTSIPVQFVPASYWGCMPLWPPQTGSGGSQSPPSSTSNSCCSGDGSQTLGKHGRGINLIDDEKPGKCIVVPRT